MYIPSLASDTFYFAAVAMVALVLVAAAPVSADVIQPINPTRIYFEDRGTPVNETVLFTVACYGSHSSGAQPQKPGTPAPESVFRFSGTCPSYGCTVFESYRNIDRMRIDSCDLEGEIDGGHFIIRNFAETPRPNCTILHQDAALNRRIWERYLACSGAVAADTTTNQSRGKDDPGQDICQEQYEDELARNNLVLTDSPVRVADEHCTLQFAIPPERFRPTPTPSPLPAYGVLISLLLAGGLGAMVRKKRTR